jgi:hypothetical protein
MENPRSLTCALISEIDTEYNQLQIAADFLTVK